MFNVAKHARDHCTIFSNGGKFRPDYGLLLELHTLTLVARSYVLLRQEIPYSAKFSKDKIFADWPLTNFCRNKFRGSRSLATPCSAACFALLVELRLGPSWFIRLSSSTTRLKPETPPHWQTQLVPPKKLTMAAPRNLEVFALKQR